MASSGSLQQMLRNLDGSAPSVQKAASAMIKHYDQTAAVAVTEWRNALSTSSNSKHLISLLYVANEVLQISKRNRGNKFLEAFSVILGQSLQHICRQDPSLIEKVRRTVKIWGDRRVFSVRFVQELLLGLESFRPSAPAPAPAARRSPPTSAAVSKPSASTTSSSHSNLPSSRPTFQDDDDDEGQRFSPDPQSSPQSSTPATTAENDDGGSVDEDVIELLEANDDDDDDDDDDDIFASENTLLKVDIDLEQVGASNETTTDNTTPKGKRRRGSLGSVSSGASGGKRRRRTSATTKSMSLSTNSLLELSSTVSKLQDDFEDSERALARIDKNLAKTSVDELGQIVGDELMVEFRKVVRYQEQVATERKRLHTIAQDRKGLEQEAVTYLPWLEKALDQDQKDVEFCARLEKELESFLPIHAILKQAREIRRAEELKRMELEAERDRVRREKEESERFRQESLRRQTEQSDGMVWNPTTREYVHLNTEESWRD